MLPIGGLKQKALAAHAAGLTDVILPERNRGDLDEIPEEVREQMSFHPVMSIDEVLELALEPAPAGRAGLLSAAEPARKSTMATHPTQMPAGADGGPPGGGPPGAPLAAVDHLRRPDRRDALQRIRARPSTGSRRGCSPSGCATSRRRD